MEKAMHTIKMGYGVSRPVYGNEVIPVIQMCKDAGHRIEIATAITKMAFSLIGFAFVVQAAAEQDTSEKEMIDEFQDFMRR